MATINKVSRVSLNVDVNTYLLLHFNGADGATSTVDDTGRHGTINCSGTAQLDTSEKKFGTASLILDGDGDYLGLPDSSDWDICGSLEDDWTIDLWIKYSSTLLDYKTYLCQFENANNYWTFRSSASSIKMTFLHNGTLEEMGSGIKIDDTNWHHVAMIKIDNVYSIYLDGTQISYNTTSATDTYASTLRIGIKEASIPDYFYGFMDEIRIQHSNIFNASPNVGKTDTIVVPTSEYGKQIKKITGVSN
jgi:hypothetical protein